MVWVTMDIASLMQIVLVLLLSFELFLAAPSLFVKSWPSMKTYDVWNAGNEHEQNATILERSLMENMREDEFVFGVHNKAPARTVQLQLKNIARKKRVLNFFPVLGDEACLSDDGRRFGSCLNVYECRRKGGSSRGECALGFGVCCVFLAECGQEVKNNITYIVSPNFPSFLPRNMTSCKITIPIISADISQLRIDFNHFSLGQPNRTTGVCDGDVFKITGGSEGMFQMCGQNSGQHIYYEIGRGNRSKSVQQTKSKNVVNTTASASAQILPAAIEILMYFTNSSLVSLRLWEIRVTQIPFSQRAPAGCLQYYTGPQGFIQTFNFAENGRHLANQNYKACLRQENDMCSIIYEPCDEKSFRIGPTSMHDDIAPPANISSEADEEAMNSTSFGCPHAESGQSLNCAALSTTSTERIYTTQRFPIELTSTITNVQADNSDTVEGSGAGEILPLRPVRGGFDIFDFFSKTFGFQNKKSRGARQLIPICTDRITIPCIVEDFIEGGSGSLPECEPVHCGSRFCSALNGPCKVESTVIPFRVGIHFGKGIGKGSPEDNIGMCLKYRQVACM